VQASWGRYYALNEKAAGAVADAIGITMRGWPKRSLPSCAGVDRRALADKLEALTSFW